MDSQTDEVPQSRRGRMFLAYALIACAMSWAIEIPLALKEQGIISAEIPFTIHYLAAFGPFIAGIILTWHENGSAGLKDLFARLVKWRVAPVWWLVALSPLLLFFTMAIAMRLLQGSWIDFGMLRHFDFLPDMGVWVVFVWLATYGFGEETGWRGYLLPRLQRNRSAWSATLILWIIWAIWHIPSFFYLHTVNGPGTLVGFLLGVLAGAVFLTWLYNSSGGSILIVAIWHGLFDYVTACIECKSGAIAATVSTLVMVWAVAVYFIYKPKNLAGTERHAV